MLDGRGFWSTGMNTDKVISFFKKTSEDMVSQIIEKMKASLVNNTNEDGFNNGVSYVQIFYVSVVSPSLNGTQLTQVIKSRKHTLYDSNRNIQEPHEFRQLSKPRGASGKSGESFLQL